MGKPGPGDPGDSLMRQSTMARFWLDLAEKTIARETEDESFAALAAVYYAKAAEAADNARRILEKER